MFARIIPVVRTPLGVEGFDYHIPFGMSVVVGDLVRIPFRRKPSVGLITQILERSPFADRALSIEGSYANLRLPDTFPSLVHGTAARTFCSPGTVLVSWMRHLPKKPHSLNIVQNTHKKRGLHGSWMRSPTTALIEEAKTLMETHRVLIVSPWMCLARELGQRLSCPLLHSGLADGEAFLAWTRFLSEETGCLVTTKIGAWLSIASDIVLLHEPEQDDHKQDELTPRYDARKVLLWAAERGLAEVRSYGLTPPLHAESEAPTIEGDLRLHIHHPQGRSTIPLIQADSLQALIDHEGPRSIIHPISGSLARINCRDCAWQATCPLCTSGLGAEGIQALCRKCRRRFPMPEQCPQCGGADLSKSLPGIDRLRALWEKQHPTLIVEWRTTTAETLEAPFPDGCMVVVTDAAWLAVSEDIRKPERQCIAIRRLLDRIAAVKGILILQTHERLASCIEEWLTPKGMKDFVEATREERARFGYPPSKRVVKILFRDHEEMINAWRVAVEHSLNAFQIGPVQWRGPLIVPRRPITRGIQRVLHLVLPPSVPESSLIKALTPHAKQVTIDLDPVSFLR